MARAAQCSLTLTDRDIAIITMVFSYGGCGIRHVQARLFPSTGARSACYARVASLVTAEYLGSQRLPAASGQGSGPLYLTVGTRARPLLAKFFNLSRSALRRQARAKSPFILGHDLAIVDFRLALELAVEASPMFDSVQWTSELALRRHPLMARDPRSGEVIPLIADGAFTLSRTDGAAQHFLLELDRGTVPGKRLSIKLRGYLACALQPPVPILFVTSTTRRVALISRLAVSEANRLGDDPTIFWATTQAAITTDSILAKPVWQVAGGPHAFAIGQLDSHGGAP